MAQQALDVVGIGNAIVDVLSQTDDKFLATHQMAKGGMTLIDAAQAEQIYGAMGPGIEMSGGSVANTMAGIASLGGKGAFFGKVRNDQLGEVFRHDIRAIGVQFDTPAAKEGLPTARCLILVTPDGQRTMNTFLGVSVDFGPEEIDEATIKAATITYLEGYLWDPPKAKQAFLKAAQAAHAAGRKVALSLSDAFCVARHRDSFRELVDGHIDILFANESEIISLYEAKSFDEALQQVRGKCEIAALTRSEKGSVVVAGKDIHSVPAAKVAKVVDTTGAGDLYAAGFLYGVTHGKSLVDCAKIGGIAAAEAIGHMGARPATPLAALVKQQLG